METRGLFTPADAAAARERYAALATAAGTVTREVARALDADPDEAVVETAHEALFASLLEVRLSDRAAYESWLSDHPDWTVVEHGSDQVDQVAWHPAPAAETVVAATYDSEPAAAAAALRRQAFGTVYGDLL
ncbi:MAG: DUF5809 family protein [Halobacteriaceae archaeon]